MLFGKNSVLSFVPSCFPFPFLTLLTCLLTSFGCVHALWQKLRLIFCSLLLPFSFSHAPHLSSHQLWLRPCSLAKTPSYLLFPPASLFLFLFPSPWPSLLPPLCQSFFPLPVAQSPGLRGGRRQIWQRAGARGCACRLLAEAC